MVEEVYPRIPVKKEETKEERHRKRRRQEKIDKEQAGTGSSLHLPVRIDNVGPTGAGKTRESVRWFRDLNILKGKFRVIVRCSPTAADDPEWEEIFTECPQFVHYDYFTDDIAKRLYEEQSAIPKKDRDHVLLYIDDNAYGTREGEHHWLDRCYVSGRHKKISIIKNIQKFQMSSPVQLEQLSDLNMWPSANENSQKAAYRYFGAGTNFNFFRDLYMSLTSQPYHFVHFQKASGGQTRVLEGLDKVVLESLSEFALANNILARGSKGITSLPTVVQEQQQAQPEVVVEPKRKKHRKGSQSSVPTIPGGPTQS
jgi:hypothetical protein